MTITEYLDKHGAHKTARKLVDQRIESNFGLSLDELGDTCEMANLVDTVAGFLEDDSIDKACKYLREELTMEFIAENVFG